MEDAAMAASSGTDLTGEVAAALRHYMEEAAELDRVIAERAGIGLTDLHCLDLLERNGGRMTAGTLAELSGLTTGAITGVINRLERSGLARRTADPHDKRRVIVQVAAARGRRLLGPRSEVHTAVLGHYDPDHLAVLLDLLRAAAAAIAERVEDLRAVED
jgi:DNA-binding MarR family transcriptional regulator